MKTVDEVLQELLAICDGWELVWDNTELQKHCVSMEHTIYVFCNVINDYYGITIDCKPFTNQYMAYHSGIKYDDNRSECSGYADSAEHAFIQLQFAMRKRAKNILEMVNEMTNIRKNNGNSC
jgi:hypothetical protein